MPRNNYKCLYCGNIFEKYVINSYEEVACPKCKGTNVQKNPPSSVNPSTKHSPSSSCG